VSYQISHLHPLPGGELKKVYTLSANEAPLHPRTAILCQRGLEHIRVSDLIHILCTHSFHTDKHLRAYDAQVYARNLHICRTCRYTRRTPRNTPRGRSFYHSPNVHTTPQPPDVWRSLMKWADISALRLASLDGPHPLRGSAPAANSLHRGHAMSYRPKTRAHSVPCFVLVVMLSYTPRTRKSTWAQGPNFNSQPNNAPGSPYSCLRNAYEFPRHRNPR
jgi:hypothetical protein